MSAEKTAKRKADTDVLPSKKPKLSEESNQAVQTFLTDHEITIHQDSPPQVCLSLNKAPFPSPLVKLLCAQPGFTTPSAIQASTWPLALSGRDILAIAKTGSGKTLGFLLPVLSRCFSNKTRTQGTPTGLIMAPTRELALQIAAQAAKFGPSVGCRTVAVYGGASKNTQISALQRGCELIVGTPGRIKDVLDIKGNCHSAAVSVENMSVLVLDEADRMLDMGFEWDIRSIVWGCFEERPRQTLLYSATWPLAVQAIAADLLSEPVKVTVGTGGDKLTANKSVTQRVHVVQSSERWDCFVKLIRPFCKGGADAKSRVIVFCNMKVTVKQIAEYCGKQGLAVGAMSGARSQSQREKTIKQFKAGEITVVVATDVAARGLDIKGIERVINYELPMDDFQDYVHRIGRTGRAGATGVADSLFTDGDKLHAKELIRILTDAGQEVPLKLAQYVGNSVKFSYDSDSD